MFLMAENGRWKGEAENGEYQMKGSAVLQQRVGELKLWSIEVICFKYESHFMSA